MALANLINPNVDSWEKSLPRKCLIDRDLSILELCRGKRVLHLGAADAPMHQEKAERGELLHQKLTPICGELLGIDSNAEAVEYLKSKHHIENLVVVDLSKEKPLNLGHWDVVLCCDIIEHVENIDNLIEGCKLFMNKDSILVLTTINAISLKLAGRAFFSREAVHPDHIAYFSFSTLSRIVLNHSLVPIQAGFFAYRCMSKLTELVFAAIYKYAPGTADGIILISKKKVV